MVYFRFMTICEFLAMKENDQTEAIWCNTHIAERQEGKYWILLYQVESFYVELYYDQEKGEIQHLNPFTSTAHKSKIPDSR